MASCLSPHFVIFPFMSKGHTIPLLHLTRLLSLRNIAVTIFTTQSNSPFIHHTLTGSNNISVIELPFPEKIPDLPDGVENTDQLPSMSFFIPFAKATILLQPHFERILETLLPVNCMISDGFLGWTLESASKYGIPRLVSYGTNSYSMVVGRILREEYPNLNVDHIQEPLTLKSFPLIIIDKNELVQEELLQVGHPIYEFAIQQSKATSNSWGILFNTFYELESSYVNYWNSDYKPRAWCLGPLCLQADPPRVLQPFQKPLWMQWLDSRKGLEKQSVLYVAFGSQASVPPEQLKEIAIGLERSKVSFLWVLRSKEMIFDDGLCERVKDTGLVVREWVDQTEVLEHECVQGFLSHCGWNSVLESICALVPILAWPMMAEQSFNAKMVEELGIGLRMQVTENTGARTLVKSEKVEKMVRKLMLGDEGKEAKKKVKNIGESARRAMEEGGSSKGALDLLIDEVCQ
ncbi:Glycosyltransferase [Thalictrum thalictroides]|uniref:Glycosyltransferase n=1 Tax=Thalictrum thalictroides TaxID=46969 RepID=A0A7J6USN1_THATH|nr:Glycosyltransferase [Thalictrum thalictroides]